MGQYFRPCIVKKVGEEFEVVNYMLPEDYDNGRKLMEHSYLENRFVRTFEKILFKNQQRVVWSGDYSDKEKNGQNLFDICQYSDKIRPNIVNKVSDPLKVPYRYLINHDKQLFVNKRILFGDKKLIGDGLFFHPLPLLTCEGNGSGGGDYWGENEIIGSWSRDLISCDNINYGRVGYRELDLTQYFK